MANKVDITLLESVTANDSAAVLAINNNFIALRNAINNTLSRDGTSPNYMDDVLDMNSYRIINTAEPKYDSDFVTLGWVKAYYGNIEEWTKRAEAAAISAEEALRNSQSLVTYAVNAAQSTLDISTAFEKKWNWSKFENVSWTATFVSNPASTFYPYKSTMQFLTVNNISERVPYVMFSAEDVIAGNIASYATTDAMGLTIYTKEPLTNLVIPAIIFQ